MRAQRRKETKRVAQIVRRETICGALHRRVVVLQNAIWRGLQGKNARKAAPMLEFTKNYPFINPKFALLKLPMLGNTRRILVSLTPNQRAKVAPYCSTEVVGSKRPEPTSSLLFKPMIGKVP